MYGISGRSWVCMGDPIGPPDAATELAWQFRELVDRHDGWTVLLPGRRRAAPALPRPRARAAQARRGGDACRWPTSSSRAGAPRAAPGPPAARARGVLARARPADRRCPRGCPLLQDDLRRVARGEEHPREGLLARLLRAALPRRGAGRARPRSSERMVAFANLWAAPREGRALDRPDALPAGLPARGDGLPLRRADALGTGARATSGSTSGWRRSPGSKTAPSRPLWNRVGALALPPRRALLQLPGAAPVQGEVRPAVGAALPRRARRAAAADRAHEHRRARLPRRRRGRVAMISPLLLAVLAAAPTLTLPRFGEVELSPPGRRAEAGRDLRLRAPGAARAGAHPRLPRRARALGRRARVRRELQGQGLPLPGGRSRGAQPARAEGARAARVPPPGALRRRPRRDARGDRDRPGARGDVPGRRGRGLLSLVPPRRPRSARATASRRREREGSTCSAPRSRSARRSCSSPERSRAVPRATRRRSRRTSSSARPGTLADAARRSSPKAAARPKPRARPPAAVADLPLVEVKATAAERDAFVLLVSGDGGWAGIDQELAKAFAADGLPVVGLNSLRYFWQRKTAEQTSSDLGRVVTPLPVRRGRSSA